VNEECVFILLNFSFDIFQSFIFIILMIFNNFTYDQLKPYQLNLFVITFNRNIIKKLMIILQKNKKLLFKKLNINITNNIYRNDLLS
jgi:hypothetical protein